jgi:putative phosphoesterase
MLVGLISDTHGLMRGEALAALHGVDIILHAGDVGGYSVLRELEGIAPTRAVTGNTDDPQLGLPRQIDVTLDGVKVLVTHGHELGSPNPSRLVRAYTADVIVYGHTHKPLIDRLDGTLVVNPGAAGPRRFNLQPTIARLTLHQGTAAAEIVALA